MSEASKPPVQTGPVFIVLVVIACAVILLAILLPSFNPGGPSKRFRIINNLVAIETAKEMWASDQGATGSVQVTEQDLAPYMRGWGESNSLVTPVMGERYVINPLGVPPEAHLTRKYGKAPPGTIIRYIRHPGVSSREEIILPNSQGERESRGR
jgi:hypothetical protein